MNSVGFGPGDGDPAVLTSTHMLGLPNDGLLSLAYEFSTLILWYVMR